MIAEANRIFGFDGWQRETVALRCVSQAERRIGREPSKPSDPPQRDGWGVTYTARVRVIVGGIVREGSGAGHGIDVDLGQAHESALKEAETDAMKRALMTFGNPFGLALYDKQQREVTTTEHRSPLSGQITERPSGGLPRPLQREHCKQRGRDRPVAALRQQARATLPSTTARSMPSAAAAADGVDAAPEDAALLPLMAPDPADSATIAVFPSPSRRAPRPSASGFRCRQEATSIADRICQKRAPRRIEQGALLVADQRRQRVRILPLDRAS